MLLTSFMASPWPSAPTWKTFLPIARKRSSQAFTVSAGPPAMIDSSPEAARSVPPLTGASTIAMPRAASVLAEPARRERVDRAHAGHDVPGPRALDDAVLAGDDGLGLRGRLHHADRPADGAGATSAADAATAAPCARSRSALAAIDVVHDQQEPVLDEIERHRAAHGPEPDESHGIGHRVLSLTAVRSRSRVGDPRPVLGDRPGVHAQIEARDHLGVVRGEEHRRLRVVARARQPAGRHHPLEVEQAGTAAPAGRGPRPPPAPSLPPRRWPSA